MNQYFENDVCDRLAEAGVLAGNNDVKIEVDGLGITVRKRIIMRDRRKDFSKRVSFLDLSEAKFNVLLLAVKEAIDAQ